MNIHSPNENDKSFEHVSANLGFSVSVVIHPPTDERLENGLNFLDPNQILPLVPFVEQAAVRFAGGNAAKAQDLLQAALSWNSGKSLSDEEKFEGMRILDAAFEARIRAYKAWQLKNLVQ